MPVELCPRVVVYDEESFDAAVRAHFCVGGASETNKQVGVDPVGESAAEARQVFRPFYSDKLHGLGLGLSISRSLVENNGGRLIYDNQPQKSFVMLLPSADPADV